MAKKKTINFNFSEKHIDYIRSCLDNTYNIAEGAVRAGKTVDNIFAFAHDLMLSEDRIHLATGSTVANAKLNIGDANGFGLEYIFRGQCKWSKYKDNEALIIKGLYTGNKERIIIFAGGAKADSFKKIRGNSYGMWIATEINLHHSDTIKEAFNRTAAAKTRKFFWDLNPSHPKHWIYTDYIDKYIGNDLLKVNYEHFTIDDNINISEQRRNEIKAQYDKNSVWYRRDILGLRSVAEGLIYRQFANNINEFLCNGMNYMSINIGVDFGGNKSKHAFVATGITHHYKDLVVLKSARIEPEDINSLVNEFLNFVLEIQRNFGPITAIYADSAEQVLIKTLQNALLENNLNIKVRNSIKNEIVDRIRIVNRLIAERRFFYLEGTESLQEALTMAVWNPDKLDLERLDDGTSDIDSLDAFEYSFEKYIKAFSWG